MPTSIDRRARRPGVARERLTLGLGLIGLGLLLTLEQLGLVALGGMRALWPLLLVAAGVGRLLAPGRRAGGVALLGLGLIFLLHGFHVARLQQTWPLFLVLGGASLLIRDRDGACARPEARDERTGGPA